MHYRLILRSTALALLIAAASALSVAQKADSTRAAEAKAEVPALKQFHTVIFKLWHTAWPNKDTTMLGELAPDVTQGATAIANAKLPGILRDKQEAWDRGVKELNVIVGSYNKAIGTHDGPALLSAAEALHSQYEKLVRIVRPAMKELDDFHAVLYMLHHYYVPNDSTAQIRSASIQLKTKMEALNGATLPERLKSKQAAFESARKKLAVSVEALSKAGETGSAVLVKKAEAAVHADYQVLEKIFE